MKLPPCLSAFFCWGALITLASADDLVSPTKKDDNYPEGNSLSEEAAAAVKKFTVAPGLNVEVWASEPLLANPVALSFDQKGRAYIAETYRRRTSAQDIRKHEDWTIEDLALRTMEDRVAFLKAKFPESVKRKPTKDLPDFNNDGQFDWRDLEVESERIKVVEDSNGDGKADQARVLADGFNSLATVVGAGVLAHGDDVYYTCLPDLWKIRSDGTKEKLLTGFGVHVVYSGHEMHGAKIGPDGRLYWSIADCGAHVVDKEGQVIDVPDCGAIFRCELDGSGLELVAKGLRNPQSLAWNDVGDLFTGDNNADGGDKARWIHVVEGADYGWRIGWQFLPKLGAWNSEGMWHLDAAEKNLMILPPVGHIGHGPAGIAYYPGTGLPDTYKEHFFYADFPGGVRGFKLTPKGATYTVENPGDILQDNSPQKLTGKVLWGLYPSDVAFAPGGGLYVLDWIQGWEKTGKGRIFRVFDSATDTNPLVQETKLLLNEGFRQCREDELLTLLGHSDQRVRLGAQFELVRRDAFEKLAILAADEKASTLARLHAIWAMGQLVGNKDQRTLALAKLMDTAEPEVRGQAIRTLGDRWRRTKVDLGQDFSRVFDRAVALLADANPRVRFFTAEAFGKIDPLSAGPHIVEALDEKQNDDVYIRFALAHALSKGDKWRVLSALMGGKGRGARIGALLAFAYMQGGPVEVALGDKDPSIVTGSAQIIHDRDLRDAWPELSALALGPDSSEAVWRRVINANYLLGTAEEAERLGNLATNGSVPPPQRIFAIESLTIWSQPFGRDRITGLWRNLPPRSEAKGAKQSAAIILPSLLVDVDESVRIAACRLAGEQKVDSADAALQQLVSGTLGPKAGGAVRAAALEALGAIGSPNLGNALQAALSSNDKALLECARKLAGKVSPQQAVKVNALVLGKGAIREQQEALATIAQQAIPEADTVLGEQLDLLANGKLSPALSLDVLEAAAKRQDASVKARLAAFEQSRKPDDSLANWRECLEGGDVKPGREIFFEKAEAACLRCHKVKGEGGDVGPDLAGVGKKYDREYLLRSIIEPNAVIAQGYDNVMLTLADGSIAAGILSAEDPSTVTLKSIADGSPQKIEKAKIKERTAVPSAMPPGLGEVLGKRGLRDVIEYLATLK